jgi:hypothetical protein
MMRADLTGVRLSEGDLDFLIETVAPTTKDIYGMKRILREDPVLRNSFIQNEQVFRRVIDDDRSFLRMSPSLFFEVLLRKARQDLKQVSYTLEKTRTMSIPVFDTDGVVELLADESHLIYLADMLASFTKIQSYTVVFKEKGGSWRRIRFNDLDIHSLRSFCELVEEEYRIGLYKRIADICLFILGIFPEHVERDYRYPFSGQLRPQSRGKTRMSPEEYEEQGQKFYRMAAERQSTEFSEIFQSLSKNFLQAKKPLNFIADHYLYSKKHHFFG